MLLLMSDTTTQSSPGQRVWHALVESQAQGRVALHAHAIASARCTVTDLMWYCLQDTRGLSELTSAAEACAAETEAFLHVAEFTIKEARGRVLYRQPWPQSRPGGA